MISNVLGLDVFFLLKATFISESYIIIKAFLKQKKKLEG